MFEPGEPLGARGNTCFGLQVMSREQVARWAPAFGEPEIESSPSYAGFKAQDPEGNRFEIYWEKR